ncbi:hypothetical protein [Azospirillum endophyticum]
MKAVVLLTTVFGVTGLRSRIPVMVGATLPVIADALRLPAVCP